jgi:hypothetical protein
MDEVWISNDEFELFTDIYIYNCLSVTFLAKATFLISSNNLFNLSAGIN